MFQSTNWQNFIPFLRATKSKEKLWKQDHNNVNTSWRACAPVCLSSAPILNPATHLFTPPQLLPAPSASQPSTSPCFLSFPSSVSHSLTCWRRQRCAHDGSVFATGRRSLLRRNRQLVCAPQASDSSTHLGVKPSG